MICATFLLLLGAGSASAATYTVTTLGDSAGTCSGTSPNFSCTTLRAAITAANLTLLADDTIQFSVAGTINVGSALPTVTDTLTINGSGIILNGGGGSYYAIRFLGAGASGSQLLNTSITNFWATTPATRLSAVAADGAANVTISNNTVTAPNSAASDGIRCSNADNCTVTNNTVNGAAYAIAVFNTTAQPAGFNGTVTGNIVGSSNNSGIGLFNADNVIIDNNTIAAQFVGIRLTRDSALDGGHTSNNTITNNTITGAANDGILLDNFYTTGLLNAVNNNLIQGNTISGGSGNGIRLESNSVVQINENVITGNTIANNGGDGVIITGTNATNNGIYNNIIYANGGLGIDLNNDGVTANDAGDADTGVNGLQNFPVLTGVTGSAVSFVLDTTANANGYRIDFYNNPDGVDPTGYGEGQTWLGSCIVSSPSATIPSTCSVTGVDPATLRMTATRCLTAACTSGSTSEFSGPAVTDLRISKTDGITVYTPGQNLTYTLVVTNAGTTPVTNAVFADPAVTGLTVNSVTCGGATAGSQCPAVADTSVALMQGSGIVIPTLSAGGSVTFTVTATVSAGMTGNLSNTATITPPLGVTETAPADNTATDTDEAVPLVTIRKISLGGAGSFDFTGDNGIPAQTLTTTAAGTPVSGATLPLTSPATVTTLAEAIPAEYLLTGITCEGLGSGGTFVPDLSAGTVTLDAAATAVNANITCTFTNTRKQTDVQVVKTASSSAVVSGGELTYTITVSNNGPLAADNAVLTDALGAGQTCTAASCDASGGATCPAGGTAGEPVAVADLTGAGITLPSLPVGGQVVVTLTCTVTASGL